MESDLKKWFGYTEFKGKQQFAIQSLLNGKDVVLISPTGAGKR